MYVGICVKEKVLLYCTKNTILKKEERRKKINTIKRSCNTIIVAQQKQNISVPAIIMQQKTFTMSDPSVSNADMAPSEPISTMGVRSLGVCASWTRLLHAFNFSSSVPECILANIRPTCILNWRRTGSMLDMLIYFYLWSDS